jgi:hypothetical protein
MMMGLLLPAMLCIAAVVFAAVILIVITLLNPNHAVVKSLQSTSNAFSPSAWMKWMVPFILALLLAIWTIWGALFFFAVAWLMRQNPGPDVSSTVGENEKKTARRIYAWLFWSSFLTVPMFIISIIIAYDSSVNARVLAALTPVVLHTPLLFGLASKSRFVYRHTQQGILLIALRAGLASLAVSAGSDPEDGWSLFLLGNGALWLFGSIWGWNQIHRSDCWLMRRKRERMDVAIDKAGNLAPHIHLEKSREFLQSFKKAEAKDHALAAFRKGDREIRAQAVWLLEVLEEVEKF